MSSQQIIDSWIPVAIRAEREAARQTEKGRSC